MKLSKELKTGFIAIVAITLLIWGYNYLKKQNLFKPSVVYYTEFKNVQGLTPSSPVTINGFQVGNVTNIKFNKNKKGSLIVSYTLTEDFTFSKNSKVQIIPPTISGMGTAELTIIPSYDGETAKSGTYLKGEVQQGIMSAFSDKLNPLNSKLNNVLANADKLLLNVNNVLDTKTQQNLKLAISKLTTTLNNFSTVSKKLDDLLLENKSKIAMVLDNFNKSAQNLDGLTTEFKNANLTTNLKQTMTKLDKSLASFDNILVKAEKGDGSIAKLLNDKGLYTNLENASKEMEELLREMKEHPKRFVHFSLFGKKDKKGYVKDTVN